jgi:hypothetical protein
VVVAAGTAATFGAPAFGAAPAPIGAARITASAVLATIRS